MAAPVFETLLYDVADGIATITLNRPDKLNAFNEAMCNDLQAAFDATDADPAVKAVIMTGTGRAFCSGADLSGGAAFTAEPGGEVPRDKAGLVTLRMYRSLKPVIGAINGASVGVGVTMQLAMDVRLASNAARFAFAFSRRGIVMEGCSAFFLPRLVGMANALDWCYSGRIFPAQEALDKGLVSALYEPDALMPAARALARDYVDNAAPVSVSLTRQMCWRMLGASHPMEAHITESRALYSRFADRDAREGVNAFLEKREPAFDCKVPDELPNIWPGWVEPEFDPSPLP
ncbi:MAG: crotonase/enoyl-CoA hydratase family protein [Caulobacteraceae bacterium]|nr:crotonase/enoyl-CoA hydratase family protein [Caulobacteraceae bacterium]